MELLLQSRTKVHVVCNSLSLSLSLSLCAIHLSCIGYKHLLSQFVGLTVMWDSYIVREMIHIYIYIYMIHETSFFLMCMLHGYVSMHVSMASVFFLLTIW